ncbi:5-formyltetrahydrofolate cyclo-ligase [Pontibacter sp. BT310]|uniref:5-formyltetrahydrofolate cyclo-ligase n=1 Tax=Pontibacter populi TaxID=890055 RepID=A0ABS6X8G0_9BACT|nr:MULTISPECIES: 5-formyltetrahydrofolate cyclo-ligase [Pontibacter]MBJ6117426.1 5-formyltetrahydrofolate cyclo-ligase [Pontibacter sp. BT310]MBR0569851.1 5-formyltetrahydrofolate cyclo-ligase [Microvirga sp. STS03]MBW3364279.1 5-formyltetrahydrofolate cyclo-ligase [Pontibacter populi]
MLKAELRKLMLQKRRALPLEEVQRRSEAIADQFFANFPLQPGQTVHVFLPIVKNNEVNTWPIIERLRLKHPQVRVAVPVTDVEQNILTHHHLTNEAILVENPWGIPEPQNAQHILAPEVDLVLIPLLAFDRVGHRVGYGKGFYDRFLADCRPDVLKVGLSLEPPVLTIADPNPFDVPLDAVIMPDGVWRK